MNNAKRQSFMGEIEMFGVQVHGDDALLGSLREALAHFPVSVNPYDPDKARPGACIHIARSPEQLATSVRQTKDLCVVFETQTNHPDIMVCNGRYPDAPESLLQLMTTLTTNTPSDPAVVPYEKLHALFDEVVSVGHHDFSEPARNIAFFADLLSKDDLAADRRADFMDRTRIAGARLQALIRDLTRYARVWLRPVPEETLDPENIARIVGEASSRAHKRVGQLEARAQEIVIKGSAHLQMPERFLSRIAEELIANALEHHSGNAGPLHLRIDDAARKGMIQVEVCDDGPGILVPSGVSLFRPFYRNERNDELRTGIGLALVKALCERAGGEVILIPISNSERMRLCLLIPGKIPSSID